MVKAAPMPTASEIHYWILPSSQNSRAASEVLIFISERTLQTFDLMCALLGITLATSLFSYVYVE